MLQGYMYGAVVLSFVTPLSGSEAKWVVRFNISLVTQKCLLLRMLQGLVVNKQAD